MTDIIWYRGPDDEGFAVWGHVINSGVLPRSKSFFSTSGRGDAVLRGGASIGLGHRRLSILDLSAAGHQPMASACGRFWIVYNGEVYNYRELRIELATLGCRFVSNCDTEVILAAYKHWGEQCLTRFNGMWAFAIYDGKEQILFASRDRFGVKPFYYSVDDHRFAFASEIKQLRASGFGNGKAERHAVAQFLLYANSDSREKTMFEGIRQLQPGEALRLDLNKGATSLTVHRYYSPRFNAAMHSNGRLDVYRDEFRNLFEDSVRLRLRSDVPVGTCLSGGLDSSSIVLTANRLLQQEGAAERQKSFTSCFEDPRFDEWKYASVVADQAGLEAHRVFPDLNRLWDEIQDLTWHHDQPMGSTSPYAQWNVMRLASQNGVRVLLDGQGADEVMAGYHYFVLDFFVALAKSAEFTSLFHNVRSMQRTGLLGTSIQAMTSSPLQILLKAARRVLGTTALLPPVLNPVVKPEYRIRNDYPSSGGFQRLLFEAIFGSLQSLLRYEDRNSMAFSVESRVPYLDYRIVELFLNMPGGYKMRDGWTKPFIRDAMADIMPEIVRLRVDKKGFVTPEGTWYKGNIRKIRALLMADSSPVQLWIDPGALRQWLGEDGGYARVGEWSLWRLMAVHFWMERFSLA